MNKLVVFSLSRILGSMLENLFIKNWMNEDPKDVVK